MKHTLENSWREINFERLIIYIYLYTVFFNYSRRVNRWVVSSVNRPPRFCIVNFHFLWTSYVQKKKKTCTRIRYQTFFPNVFQFHGMNSMIDMEKLRRIEENIRKFNLSSRYLLQRVVINVKFIKRWPRWNPSNYRAIKLTIPSIFFTNLEIQNSIDLKYLRYL